MAVVLTSDGWGCGRIVGPLDRRLPMLVDARRRLSPFAMLVMGRDSRFRGGVAVLFCFARVVAIQWCRLKNAAVNAADQVAFEGAIMEEDVCTASFDEAAGLPELLGIEQVSDAGLRNIF